MSEKENNNGYSKKELDSFLRKQEKDKKERDKRIKETFSRINKKLEKIKEESNQERKARGETSKVKERRGSTFQEIIQEINRAQGKKYLPKDDKERIEAERQIEELEVKREEYIRRARVEGWVDERVNERIKSISEMSARGKYFSADLIRESRAPITDPEGMPEELRGLNQDYYQKEVLKILSEKLTPVDYEGQKKLLREYLKILRTGRMAPELITSNPIWIEMTSAVPYFDPELQKEFKARFEIFRYALGFKTADGVESGISGASRVLLSHIGKALEVPEIQKAYDLLEERSQITIREIMGGDETSNEEKVKEKMAKEKIGRENPLYAGTEAQKKEVLKKIALNLAETFGEKTEGLNNEEKDDLAEKYMWAVEEADDVWRITFRSDESDIGMEGRGGQWYLNRLFHFPARLKAKGFGYESTRKYFNRPLLPVWIEGEPILPILTKKGELQIKSEDIEKIRQRLEFKGLSSGEIEKRLKEIKKMSLEGRGLMMKGLWQYQIDFLKIDGLEKLKFNQEGDIKYTKDGNGRELPYIVYKRKFTAPNGEEKEMIIRIGVLEKNKHAVKKADRYEYASVLDIENPSAEILSDICQQVPEGFYGSYVGDWIIKAENTRKLLEAGVLKFPLGSEDDVRRLLAELQSKNLFDYLDPLAKDKGRKPGKYYREDAWEDLIRGSIDFGLHEGKKMFEPWKMWGAWRAGVLTKAATDLKVITDYQGRKIENEMLTFLGMKGNIPRWLRCNFDRYTMVFRWGPMRMMMLGEMLKRFFEGIFQGPPFSPSK